MMPHLSDKNRQKFVELRNFLTTGSRDAKKKKSRTNKNVQMMKIFFSKFSIAPEISSKNGNVENVNYF